jgi:glyoxalase family protein
MTSRGIHHLTTVIGDAPRIARFYSAVLGLRCVKKTVCYDDPGSHHIYFGDQTGRPGTVISALGWRCVPHGMIGVGEVVQTALRVPWGSLDAWAERLREADIAFTRHPSAFGEPMMCLTDPEGTSLALVEAKADDAGWSIKGLHDLTLTMRGADATIDIVQDVLGFECVSDGGELMRFVAHDGPGGLLTLRVIGPSSRGRLGGGTIRHVAFRAADADDQSQMVEKLRATYGMTVSDPIERTYLKAVCFRAPCGVLFEIATDGPGFAVDEPPEKLGEKLQLPAFLEERRSELQAILPALDENVLSR